MDLTAVTVGIPVRDLEAATKWYRAAFDLGPVDLEPIEGLVEFKLGAIWLQLAQDRDHAGGEGISLNLSVKDATAERKRLANLGLDVTAVHRIEGVVDIFTLTDPEGNKVGFVTELA